MQLEELIFVLVAVWAILATIVAAIMVAVAESFGEENKRLKKACGVVRRPALYGWTERLSDEGSNLTSLHEKYNDPEIIAIRERLALLMKDIFRYTQEM